MSYGKIKIMIKRIKKGKKRKEKKDFGECLYHFISDFFFLA